MTAGHDDRLPRPGNDGKAEVVKPGQKEIRMTDERQLTMIKQGEAPAVQAPSRIADQPCVDCLDQSPAAEHRRPAIPRRVAFWLLAFVFAATMLGTTLPTPLYDIYQAQWHFSAAIVTVTFAVYAAGVLVTLLLTGRASDQAGRKPVLAAALGCSALSTVVFILAPNVGVLMAGRILSGFSAGLMTGTATATLTELIPASASRRASLVATAANMGGLGLGPLFAGLGIPERGRSEFIAAGVAGFAAFSLLGLFAGLAPTFVASVLHEPNHAVQGAVVFGLLAVGTVTQLMLSRFGSRRVVMAGLGLFLVALTLIVAALAAASMALFLAGTVVGGVAVGAVFLGSLATANRLAPPGRRGQTVSTFFVLCYAGLTIPVGGVGVATLFTGDFAAVLAFSILLAALSLFSLTSIRRALCAP